jgi:hypothetical protein
MAPVCRGLPPGEAAVTDLFLPSLEMLPFLDRDCHISQAVLPSQVNFSLPLSFLASLFQFILVCNLFFATDLSVFPFRQSKGPYY